MTSFAASSSISASTSAATPPRSASPNACSALNTDHIVYRMTSLRSRALGFAGGVESLMASFSRLRQPGENPVRRGPRGTDARGDAHAVEVGTRDGQPRHGLDGPADPFDAVQVADGVL